MSDNTITKSIVTFWITPNMIRMLSNDIFRFNISSVYQRSFPSTYFTINVIVFIQYIITHFKQNKYQVIQVHNTRYYLFTLFVSEK